MKVFKTLKGQNREKGFTQIFVLMILILGLTTVVYLVQKTQIFKPRASFTTTAEFIDLNGNPITQTTDKNVRLRIIRNTVSAVSSQDSVAIPLSGAKKVFVTSTYYTGNLGGLIGADSKCQVQANSVSLGGTYIAWLSDSTTSASSRLTHHTSAYKLINGTTIANNWNDLTDGSLLTAINITELGTTQAGAVWTNTTKTGDIFDTTNTCGNWTNADLVAVAAVKASQVNNDALLHVRSGTITNTIGSYWTDANMDFGCSAKQPLYCFEQ